LEDELRSRENFDGRVAEEHLNFNCGSEEEFDMPKTAGAEFGGEVLRAGPLGLWRTGVVECGKRKRVSDFYQAVHEHLHLLILNEV
jgi:hypothetical protein